MPDLEALKKQVAKLSEKLDGRVRQHQKVEPYLVGAGPPPRAVEKAKLKNVYRDLMPVAEAPWASLIVGSKLDRLEITGLRDHDQDAAERIWGEVFRANDLEAESKLGHGAALLDGRFHATVWPTADGPPDVALDDVTQMIVEFAEGSRRHRTAALRRWTDGDRVFATLYRPEGVYKFQGPQGSSNTTVETWEKREVDGEDWPLPNPFSPAIPVVEIGVNRRLAPGRFPVARGEFEHCIGLIDRINLLTFLGLVVAFWMGFPLRAVIGEKARYEVLKDDDGEPLIDEETGKEKVKAKPPIELAPDSLGLFENPNARLDEFKAADRKNLSVYPELDQLAVITATPRHYFPMEGGMSNLSADAIRASEGAMHAAVTGHKASLGRDWEEVGRLGGKVLDKPVLLTPQAEVRWKDSEGRSLAERADAASKLKDILPPIAIAELALNASQDQIARWAALGATDPLMELLAQVKEETGAGVPAG